MSSIPSIGVPELAGLARYEDAARIGYGVDENVRRLLRYQWVERRVMAALVAHLPATPEWEVKGGMALHIWQHAEHVEWLRTRVSEMRHPVPQLDRAPDDALDQALDEMLRSAGTVELLVGCYRVVGAALVDAYETDLAVTNPLVDHPTRRILGFALVELQAAQVWAGEALEALLGADGEARRNADVWELHLRAYLDRAGGIAGPSLTSESGELPPPRSGTPFVPDLVPRRDRRFRGQHHFDFPPHVIYDSPKVPADERNLALLCKRALEMDVPEAMASVMAEWTQAPWEFHRDYARQLWDEMRHAMMGSVALEARRVDWSQIPLNVGFSLRLNRYATPLERATLLYAIEQSLMPAATGKRAELETALAAGDPLSAHFQDYDWADEVLHTQIGRRVLKREGVTPDAAARNAAAIHERTWAALARHEVRLDSADWWDDLCRQVLGRPSALRPEERAPLSILTE